MSIIPSLQHFLRVLEFSCPKISHYRK